MYDYSLSKKKYKITKCDFFYIQKMEANYMEWMEKALSTERAGWSAERPPDVEPHTNAFHTHAPLIIFQMIDQNLQVEFIITLKLRLILIFI